MDKNIRPRLAIAIIIVIAGALGVGIWQYSTESKENLPARNQMTAEPQTQSEVEIETTAPEEIETPLKESADVSTEEWKTYRNEKYEFEFKYPKTWFLDHSRLSPHKIEDYEIGSDNAPVHFNMYAKDKSIFLNSNGSILDYSDIDCSKHAPVKITINGSEFIKCEYTDQGSYDGSTAGEMVIVVSPEIIVDGKVLYLGLEWQERPGGKVNQSNQKSEFMSIVSTIKIQ